MAVTIKQVHDAFEYLYEKLCDKSFTKTIDYESWGERSLLPLVRVYLLGYFGEDVYSEVGARLPSARTGQGKIDFFIDDVAVEFAVRKPGDPKSKLLGDVNRTEVEKLLKYPGKSILVLFDFSERPLGDFDLNEFRNLPSLGRGNHKKSPFQVSYFFKKDDGGAYCHKKQIKVA